jgi:hypothetical protein
MQIAAKGVLELDAILLKTLFFPAAHFLMHFFLCTPLKTVFLIIYFWFDGL